jgi:hypothetical protein
MQKILVGVWVVIGLFFVGTCIYFVGGVSATYPPLKEYRYRGDFAQLKDDMDKLILVNENLSYIITDTTGNEKIGRKYYVTVKSITNSSNIEYRFFYDKTDYWFKKDITEIGLVFVFDNIHKTGGYGYEQNAIEVKNLIGKFELEVLNCLPNRKTISPI